MTTIRKNFEIDKIRMLPDLDLLLKVRCLANVRSKNSVCLNSNETKIYFKPYNFNSREKMFDKKVLNKSH